MKCDVLTGLNDGGVDLLKLGELKKPRRAKTELRGSLTDYSRFTMHEYPSRYPQWYIDYCDKNGIKYDKNYIIG